jgi:predicted alpha/beta-hydrolase family hydrolase
MNQSGESFERQTQPAVRGFLHRPRASPSAGIILTHGAGSNCRAPLLVSVAHTFAESGFLVLRCDLPYRQARAAGPPRPGDAARDREGLAQAVAALRELVQGRIFLGGHSYGGRQSSMLVAERPDLVSGLLLMSYPLHPPQNPKQLRVQHFRGLKVPALFIHGTKDPFGTTEEFQSALKLVPAKTELLEIQGAGHDLNFRKNADLPICVFEAFTRLMK